MAPLWSFLNDLRAVIRGIYAEQIKLTDANSQWSFVISPCMRHVMLVDILVSMLGWLQKLNEYFAFVLIQGFFLRFSCFYRLNVQLK